MKNKLFCLFILILLLLVGCSSTNYQSSEPNFKLIVEASKLTDKEYGEIVTNAIQNHKKSDFRKLIVSFKITNIEPKSPRTIKMTNLEQTINSFDKKIRLISGGGFEQNNLNEDFSIIEYDYLLYTKDLDDSKLREMFKTSELKVNWKDPEDKLKYKIYNFGDELKIK